MLHGKIISSKQNSKNLGYYHKRIKTFRNYLPQWSADFRKRKYFFQLNLGFIVDSSTGFHSAIRVKRQKQPQELFCKTRCSLKYANFTKTPAFKFLFNRAFQHKCLPVEFAKLLRAPIWRKSANDCFWNLFKIHQDCPFLITLHFWLKLVHMFLYHNLQFCLTILPLLLLILLLSELCTSGSNWYISFCIIIYNFVWQFSLHYYWYC